MTEFKRYRWFDPLEDTPDFNTHHIGKDTDGNFCMIKPEKVVLDIFPDGHCEFIK